MKTFSMLSLTLGMALVIGTSCNNQEGGRATPIDSTNDAGTAPVQYTGGNPDNVTDTTMNAQPMDQRARQDSSNSRSIQDAQGAGNAQQPTSNTTDPKTTSGSSK